MNAARPRASVAASRRSMLALVALLSAGLAVAQTPDRNGGKPAVTSLRIAELALETSGRDLVLPATDIGSATVRACETCRAVSLLTGSRSRYVLDGEAISLPALRAALGRMPQASVVVLYARGGTEITRIIATSPPATRR